MPSTTTYGLMNDQDEKKNDQSNESEGSYSARRYYRHLGDAIADGDLEAGAELERAAKQAKTSCQGGPSAESSTEAKLKK
ncbi:MAG TPA: hypothetical protein VJV79_21335 [Polyangiaceae bacterium]|nr:hypothetical protein [Polyangiaceae bacterium]